MDRFIQHMPYDYLGKRTITLDKDKLIIDTKNLLTTISDDYPYAKIDPAFKTILRGEKEWGNVVYGLIISILVLLFLQKIIHSGIFTFVIYGIELCVMALAAYLVSLGYFKKNFILVNDTSGNTLFSLKESVESKTFVNKLKARIEKQAAA